MGVAKIDYLLLTHYHGDHAGGVVELSQLLPIGAFIDHAAPTADADEGVAGSPANLIGESDVYLIAYHGGGDTIH